MVGSLVDLQVIDELVCQHLPKVHAHILENVGGVALVTVPWFMCLFIHCLPWDATLRAIDLILAEGSRALFVIALATFHACKKEILQVEGDDLLDFLKTELKENINTLDLLKFIKFYDPLISVDLVMNLRVKYKPDIVGEIRDEIENDIEDDGTDTTEDENSSGLADSFDSILTDPPTGDDTEQTQDELERLKNMERFEKLLEENMGAYKKIRSQGVRTKYLNVTLPEDGKEVFSNLTLTARGRSRNLQIDPEISNFRSKVRPSLKSLKKSDLTTSMAILPRKKILQEIDSVDVVSSQDSIKVRDKQHNKRRNFKRKSSSIKGMKAFMSVKLSDVQQNELKNSLNTPIRRKGDNTTTSNSTNKRLSIDVSVVNKIQKEFRPFDED